MLPVLRLLDAGDFQLRSFGAVTQATCARPDRWEDARGTLFDPACFGPEENWECACGAREGEDLGIDLCTHCGVRIGNATDLRRSRWGHIDFFAPVVHPFDLGRSTRGFPVIPIAFRCDTNENDLDFLYSRIIEASNAIASSNASEEELESRLAQLVANEHTENPLEHEGRVIRSLWHYAFDAPQTRIEDLGYYLFAMGVSLQMRSS
jgi:DNA-directed RNA polymerase beta' subunit